MLTIEQTVRLADLYSEATGIALTGIGVRACGNDKIFPRLKAGKGCNVLSLERVQHWLVENWPGGIEWPGDVPRPGADCRSAA